MTSQDPVDALGLVGELAGSVPCPYMIPSRWGKGRECGAQALLYRYPDPYGYRSRCEDGHVVVLGKHSVPGLFRPLRGATD